MAASNEWCFDCENFYKKELGVLVSMNEVKLKH
jgi:hypothetical protein